MRKIILTSVMVAGSLTLTIAAAEAQTITGGRFPAASGGPVGGGGLGGGAELGGGAGARGSFGGGAVGGRPGGFGGGGMAARPPGIGGLPTAVGPTLGPGVNPGRPGFPGNVSPGGPGRPGGIADGGFGGRPGWNRPGRPGGHHHHGWHGRPYPAYGFGVGTGFGYGYGYPYGNGYYDDYYAPAAYDDEPSAPAGDAQAAYCAQRFKTYDPQTRTYVGKGGKRRSCP